MVFKGNLEIDPRGMIYESYRIEGISIEECRMIFLDWALEAAKADMRADLQTLLNEYGDINPDHPMTNVIIQGMKQAVSNGRRGGRAGRR
tara:strand:- start:31997 stop:32266 length:270 start_codon:yes stop_codon:yes gene_type:complete